MPVALLALLLACGGNGDDPAPSARPDPTGCPIWYADADGDGFGDAGAAIEACAAPAGHVADPTDCDDADATVHPGAVEVCDDADVDEDCSGAADNADPDVIGIVEVYVDADLDGFGSGPPLRACDLDPGFAPAPGDCDDADPRVFPGAIEILADDIDQDCDGADTWILFDDFELGMPNPATFGAAVGDVVVTGVTAASGALSARFGGLEGSLASRVVDASVCDGLQWGYLGRRGPEAPDPDETLTVQFHDGNGWVDLDTWEGDGAEDPTFAPRGGYGLPPGAYHPGLRFRFERVAGSAGNDHFHVDDAFFACSGGDTDGDRWGDRLDCAPSDPAHWADCTTCQDADGDGHGLGCDLGDDCDDAASDTYPGAPDPLDGIDTDCDGIDGPLRLDTFETGSLDPSVWASSAGEWAVDSLYVARGDWALDVSGTSGELVTRALDTSSCPAVTWSWLGKRGPEQPDAGDDVVLEVETPSGWIVVDTWEGEGVIDPRFVPRSGVLDDPGARWAGFRLRLTWAGSSAGSDDFYLDDVAFGCPADTDGDGQLLDCDDTDPAHWSDCGTCEDLDGDGFGVGCDLGLDCDDSDPARAPGLADPVGDALDADCSGVDGPGLFDDFELGIPSPGVFASITGDSGISSTAADGAYALRVSGGGVATLRPVDASACPALAWRYLGKRGPDAPEAGDDLRVEAWNGLDWQVLDRWPGDGTEDASFVVRAGTVPAGLGALRVVAEGGADDDWFLDDLEVLCAEDTDADRVADPIDCAPADPAHWFDCGRCVDTDGDDHGDGCDLGLDCDDDDPSVRPGAPDVDGDGRDANCDNLDGSGLFDDFESGGPSPYTWALVTGSVEGETVYVANGEVSLDLFGDAAILESVPLDTSACAAVSWSYLGKRGPEQPDGGEFLSLQYWDGAVWIEADAWEGGALDPAFVFRFGLLTPRGARHPEFRVRLVADATSGDYDHFYVDDLLVACAGPDADGDGYPALLDCDDAAPAHWFDCGACVDLDGDDFGADCDLGPDCDDATSDTFPGAADALDGDDQDCDGFDGVALTDDFERGVPDPAAWTTVGGDAAVTSAYAADGGYGLALGGGGGLAETAAIDTSACAAVMWRYQGKRGPESPDPGDALTLSWFDGLGWVIADVWEGDGTTDPAFVERYGFLTDPAAFSSGLRLRLESNGSGAGTDDFFVDDVGVGCATPDLDGDGFGGAFDCDDADPWHWADCGLCQDLDGDGFGIDCDLGTDCDDLNPALHPGAPDPTRNGVDENCDLLDGNALFDDFELGIPSPAVWGTVAGEAEVRADHPASGAYGLVLEGVTSTVETLPTNTTACPLVLWRFLGKRGPETPNLGDDVTVEWWDGAAWQVADVWAGNGTLDASHRLRWGVIASPTAFGPGFRLRLTMTGGSFGNDSFHLDDVGVGCATPDLDGDGIPGDQDCDDGDAAHWFDCGRCVDGDGDDHGVDCDLGPDCDEGDPAVHPFAPDPLGDGLDTDCSQSDGPGLFDSFDAGFLPAFWEAQSESVRYGTTYAASGTTSLTLEGGSWAETVPVDLSTCGSVLWSYAGKRGPDAPETTDLLTLSWDDGVDWVEADAWAGSNANDADFSLRWGEIAATAALRPIRIRLEASGTATDDFHIDDLRVGCFEETDGDGIPDALDCDPLDPGHWFDCGVCVDGDGDGYGDGCDLGDDCDDVDPAVRPDASDPLLDGVDADCDGLDLTGLYEPFDILGALPTVWSAFAGDYAIVSLDGVYALNLAGGGATAETLPWDTTVCTTIGWAYAGRRGPDAPESADALTLAYSVGAGWITADTWVGNAAVDPDWVQRSGTITAAAAFSPAFRIRLTSAGSGLGLDDFYLDEVRFGCVD